MLHKLTICEWSLDKNYLTFSRRIETFKFCFTVSTKVPYSFVATLVTQNWKHLDQ